MTHLPDLKRLTRARGALHRALESEERLPRPDILKTDALSENLGMIDEQLEDIRRIFGMAPIANPPVRARKSNRADTIAV